MLDAEEERRHSGHDLDPVEARAFAADTRHMATDAWGYANVRSRKWTFTVAMVIVVSIAALAGLSTRTEDKFAPASSCGGPRHPSCEWVEQHYPSTP